MNLAEAFSTGALLTLWPTAVGMVAFDGERMKFSQLCLQKCGKVPRCAAVNATKGEHTCEFGLSYFRLEVDDQPLTIFGVRGPANRNIGVREFKEKLRGRTVTQEEVTRWRAALASLINAVKGDFSQRQAEMLEPLHDPIRLAKQVQTITGRLVQKYLPGKNLEDQVDRADAEWKSLVKSAELLSESFELLTIYFNPEAASFGRRNYVSLHGLLTKLTRILALQDEAEGGRPGPRIVMRGQSFRQVPVHESFKLLPLALLTNATKYCLDGVVRVDLVERVEGVEVSVESHGPLIEADELGRIFEKRFRGRWAMKVTSGSGVGLYLARIIADTHGFHLKVSSNRVGGPGIDGIPLATNRFSFTVPFAIPPNSQT